MADVDDYHKIVTQFLLNTCRLRQPLTEDTLKALPLCVEIATWIGLSPDDEYYATSMTTGSVAEFYIEPMLSCVGDIDIMYHFSNELAIPAGTAPPTQLPDEFLSRVEVYEIVDSEFPGYVYLVLSYILTECIDDSSYNAVRCQREYLIPSIGERSGPADMTEWSHPLEHNPIGIRLLGTRLSRDTVYCMHCLSWPPQADVWPARHRDYDWPDSATVDRVVGNGCDVVYAAHRRCRQDTLMHRLSFSRAEIVLLNSWIPVQQLVYHMLRVFIKTERLTDSPDNSDVATLSNYHIKTLMLWACELKPRSWWLDDFNAVRLSDELLRTLGVWLIDARCPHYFIHNCNLFDHPDNCYYETASRLMSKIEGSLSEWFIKNYLRKCAQYCNNENVSVLYNNVCTTKELQKAVSAVVDWRFTQSLITTRAEFTGALHCIVHVTSSFNLTIVSYLCFMKDLMKMDERLCMYFYAVVFLHGAYKAITDTLQDELLDVLATTCLQSNDIRGCVNARHSSVLSLCQAAKLMKVVANYSRSTVHLIEIELSKAYLYRALRCKASDSDSIYCLANVYLAVLYYNTGHYQTAIDHCTLVTRSQDHSQCISNVVQGELLPKIDDDIHTVLGLSVFYQYVRTAALNQQQTQHVSVFTTELFAHYLHIRCLSVLKCRRLTLPSLTDEVQRYQKRFYRLQNIFTTDVLLLNFIRTKHATNDQRRMAVSSQTLPRLPQQLNTSELVEYLQQSAVEHLTAFRQVEAKMFSPIFGVVTTDFEALYAYKCGKCERCLQLSAQNVRTLFGVNSLSIVCAYPEFIQLMDDDIASLVGLMLIVDSSCRPLCTMVSQLSLSLYLMTQCQMKLHHSVTSLAQTLDYIEVARRQPGGLDSTLDKLLLKLSERKILLYISGQLV